MKEEEFEDLIELSAHQVPVCVQGEIPKSSYFRGYHTIELQYIQFGLR